MWLAVTNIRQGIPSIWDNVKTNFWKPPPPYNVNLTLCVVKWIWTAPLREGSPMHERKTYFSLFSLTFGLYINPFWPSCRQAWSPSFSLLSFYLKASSRNNKVVEASAIQTQSMNEEPVRERSFEGKNRAPHAGTVNGSNLGQPDKTWDSNSTTISPNL